MEAKTPIGTETQIKMKAVLVSVTLRVAGFTSNITPLNQEVLSGLLFLRSFG